MKVSSLITYINWIYQYARDVETCYELKDYSSPYLMFSQANPLSPNLPSKFLTHSNKSHNLILTNNVSKFPTQYLLLIPDLFHSSVFKKFLIHIIVMSYLSALECSGVSNLLAVIFRKFVTVGKNHQINLDRSNSLCRIN